MNRLVETRETGVLQAGAGIGPDWTTSAVAPAVMTT